MAGDGRPKGPASSDRRGLLAFGVGVVVVLALALLALLGGRGREGRGGEGGWWGAGWWGAEPSADGDRTGREARAARRDRAVARDADAGPPDVARRPDETHEILPEVSDPQLPGPESDPGSYDPGPGDEFIRRYQGRSGRLSPHTHPHGTRAITPQRSHMAPPNVVAVTPLGQSAMADQEMPVFATVVGRDGENVEPDSIEVTFFREEPGDGVTLPMGRAPATAPHPYEVGYVPTSDAHPPGPDGSPALVRWTVRAQGTYEGERYSRSASGFFHVSSPGGHLDTEHAEAAREASDLVVRVPVTIERAGAYFGYAELWGGPDALTPIAFARQRVEYEQAGPQVFTFLFGGAVLRERGIDGPYMVRNMRFMQVDTMPPHEQPADEEVLTTPDWPVSSFE